MPPLPFHSLSLAPNADAESYSDADAALPHVPTAVMCALSLDL